MSEYKTVSKIGTYYGDDWISNAVISIVGGYREPGKERPSFLRISILIGELQEQIVNVAIENLNIKYLKEIFPEFHCPNRRCKELMDGYLNHKLLEFLAAVESGTVTMGICFHENGLHTLENGRICAVEGAAVLGCEEDIYVVSDIAKLSIFDIDSSMDNLPHLLRNQVAAVLLTVGFVLFSFISSFVRNIGVDFQAVLNLCGPQGFGKTHLARSVAGFVTLADDPCQCPALFFGMTSSSPAGISEAMAANRDLPMVVDDFCKSAGKDTERKAREMCAKVVRDATNASIAIKKQPGGAQKREVCVAGVIITAEMELENPSDLDRCIFAPVNEPLNLPAGICAESMRGAVKTFITYFLKHQEKMEVSLKNSIYENSDWDVLRECKERPRTNLLVLRWVFRTFVEAVKESGTDTYVCAQLLEKFDEAIEESVAALCGYHNKLQSRQQEGNLAFILLKGYVEKKFNLLKNSKKLSKLNRHEGLVFQGDLCLRSTALQTFVRQQNGYHGWSLSRIVNELLDYGALCIQEDGTYQVKISKEKGVPRVYRIRLEMLEKNKLKY